MTHRIQKAVVLGAGTMGARIAAHFANAGLPCLLLDIVPKDAAPADRNKIVSPDSTPPKKPSPPLFSRQLSLPKFPSAILKTISRASPTPTGSSKSSPKISKSSAASSPESRNSASLGPLSPPTPLGSPFTSLPKVCRKNSSSTGQAPTFSIRRAT